MAVTISAPKYFTGTGPIKFSEIRDTFGEPNDGDVSGTNVRISDYKRNSADCVDWDGDDTITPRVPDATENTQLPDINENIQLQDYRNTIKKYDVTQTGTEEERVYTDGNEADWNNNLSKNVKKDYNVTGTIYANETSKYALTFEQGIYNNLDINVSGNIYGEGGAVGGGNGGGALYIQNSRVCSKVELNIASNGKIWAGGGGGTAGNAGDNPVPLTCRTVTTWNAKNAVGNTHLCNDATSGLCNRPIDVCKANTADIYNADNLPTGIINETNKNNASHANNILNDNVQWNSATNLGGNRGRCRGGRGGQGRGSIAKDSVINYDNRLNTYQCTTKWQMACRAAANFIRNPAVDGSNDGGNGGTGGSGKGFTNRNIAMNASPHKGNDGNPAGDCVTCAILETESCGNAGNAGNSGGDWGQAAASGGSGGIAIRRFPKQGVIFNGKTDNNVKGNIVSNT